MNTIQKTYTIAIKEFTSIDKGFNFQSHLTSPFVHLGSSSLSRKTTTIKGNLSIERGGSLEQIEAQKAKSKTET